MNTTPVCPLGVLNGLSTRGPYDGRQVSAADLSVLAAASATPGVDVVLITERAQIDRVRDLVIAGNTAQMADPAFVRELRTWVRFNPREALATADGLFSATTGSPTLPSWLGRRVFGLVFRAAAENDKYARQLRASAGLAIFVGERAFPNVSYAFITSSRAKRCVTSLCGCRCARVPPACRRWCCRGSSPRRGSASTCLFDSSRTSRRR